MKGRFLVDLLQYCTSVLFIYLGIICVKFCEKMFRNVDLWCENCRFGSRHVPKASIPLSSRVQSGKEWYGLSALFWRALPLRLASLPLIGLFSQHVCGAD